MPQPEELPQPQIDLWADDTLPCILLVIVNAPIVEYGEGMALTPGISLSPGGAINVAMYPKDKTAPGAVLAWVTG